MRPPRSNPPNSFFFCIPFFKLIRAQFTNPTEGIHGRSWVKTYHLMEKKAFYRCLCLSGWGCRADHGAGRAWGFAVTQLLSCAHRQDETCPHCPTCFGKGWALQKCLKQGRGVKLQQGAKNEKGKRKRSKIPSRLRSLPATTAEALAASRKHSNTQKCPGGAKVGRLAGTLAQTLNTKCSSQNSNMSDIDTFC